jgi:membrane-bound metal-dependent hydrolase YbcI (DUF457 family)
MMTRLFKSKKALNLKGPWMVGIATIAVLFYLNTIYSWVEVPTTNQFYLQIIAIVLVYSILPDIDQPNSHISRYATIALGGTALLAYFGYVLPQYGVLAVIVLIRMKWIGHRTLVHSAFFGLIVSLPLAYFFGKVHFIIGFVAYLSHIIADNDFSWGWEKDTRLFS